MIYKVKVARLSALLLLAWAGVNSAANAQESVPSWRYCDSNRVQSEAAANAASEATVNADRAVIGVVAGGSCWALSALVGFTDMGAMTLVCGAGGALVSMVSAPDEAAAKAREAYDRHRDPRCVKADGK